MKEFMSKYFAVLACFSLILGCSQPIVTENRADPVHYVVYGICQKCGHLVISSETDAISVCNVCKKVDRMLLDSELLLGYTVGK